MARLFTDILAEVDKGRLVEEATEALASLMVDVLTHGKAGSLTLTLAAAPNGDAMVFMAGKVKVSAPEPQRGKSVFHVASDGSLMRDDPRQRDLPFVRDVSTKEAVNG